MQPNQSLIHRPQPRIFKNSLDWRFLLPLSYVENMFVFFEHDPDFSQALEYVGIPSSHQLSFLEIEPQVNSGVGSLVFPFGLPIRWVGREQADQIVFFRSMRNLLGETGNLLLGFNNSWNYRSNNISAQYHFSTPHRTTSQLHKAGFSATKVFGVFPNLSIPDYIFDLKTQPINFALQHRFKRKAVIPNLVRLLSRTIGLTCIHNFLPCYFVIAAV